MASTTTTRRPESARENAELGGGVARRGDPDVVRDGRDGQHERLLRRHEHPGADLPEGLRAVLVVVVPAGRDVAEDRQAHAGRLRSRADAVVGPLAPDREDQAERESEQARCDEEQHRADAVGLGRRRGRDDDGARVGVGRVSLTDEVLRARQAARVELHPRHGLGGRAVDGGVRGRLLEVVLGDLLLVLQLAQLTVERLLGLREPELQERLGVGIGDVVSRLGRLGRVGDLDDLGVRRDDGVDVRGRGLDGALHQLGDVGRDGRRVHQAGLGLHRDGDLLRVLGGVRGEGVARRRPEQHLRRRRVRRSDLEGEQAHGSHDEGRGDEHDRPPATKGIADQRGSNIVLRQGRHGSSYEMRPVDV